MNDQTRERTIAALEGLATVAVAGAPMLGGPVAPGVAAAGLILEAAARQMRLHGKSVEEILQAIEMPPALDTSFRSEIDSKIQKKPSEHDR